MNFYANSGYANSDYPNIFGCPAKINEDVILSDFKRRVYIFSTYNHNNLFGYNHYSKEAHQSPSNFIDNFMAILANRYIKRHYQWQLSKYYSVTSSTEATTNNFIKFNLLWQSLSTHYQRVIRSSKLSAISLIFKGMALVFCSKVGFNIMCFKRHKSLHFVSELVWCSIFHITSCDDTA